MRVEGKERRLGLDAEAAFGAANESRHPRHHLLRRKGFAHIIVRPCAEPRDPVPLLDPGGHHQNGGGAELPELPAHRDAVHAGQHEVEDDKVRRGFLGGVQSGRSAAERLRLVAGVNQIVPQNRADLRIVLDNENAPLSAFTGHAGLACLGRSRVMARPPRAEAAAWIVPPCARTIASQTESPRPLPPLRRLRWASPR